MIEKEVYHQTQMKNLLYSHEVRVALCRRCAITME
jgi:sulfur relay (sulfurtransferase) complex TusBCD TusD component (DsrE family)